MAPAFEISLDLLGRRLGVWLTREVRGQEPFVPSDAVAPRRTIRPADVLPVAGGNKLSTAIKYLTQSTWSHAALYVGNASTTSVGGEHTLIEVNLGEGCVAVPLSKYDHFHTRICRPVGLTAIVAAIFGDVRTTDEVVALLNAKANAFGLTAKNSGLRTCFP